MRRLILVLLFSTWISLGVSNVNVVDNQASGDDGSSLILRCNVTGNDTFVGWKTPAGNIAANNSVFKNKINGTENDLEILKLKKNHSGTWTCLSKDGNNDIVTVTVNEFATSINVTSSPRTNISTTSINVTSSPRTNISIPSEKPQKTNFDVYVEAACKTAKVSWTHDDPNSHQFISSYKVTVKDDQEKREKEVPKTQNYSTFEGLTPNTSYQASVMRVTNASGIEYTVKKTFTTKCWSNAKMSIKAVIDGKTLVSWEPSKEGKAFYFIRYRVVCGEWMNTSILNQNEHEFSELDRGKKYEFQVYIVLMEKTHPYTNIQSWNIAYEPYGTKSSSKKKRIIAAVVISLVLLALVIIDILCCFCNKCGFFYSCMKLAKSKENYNAKDGSPQEEMKLRELNSNDPGWV